MRPQLPRNFPYKTWIFSLILVIASLSCDAIYCRPIYKLQGDIDARRTLPIIKALSLATQKDTVILYIDSQGGNLDSCLNLIKAMNESKAHAVVVHVHHCALSIAALVALEADKLILDPEAELNFSIVNDVSGKKAIIKDTIYQKDKRLSSWFKDLFEQKSTVRLTESGWPTVC